MVSFCRNGFAAFAVQLMFQTAVQNLKTSFTKINFVNREISLDYLWEKYLRDIR